MAIRTHSTVPAQTERIIERILVCGLEVHRGLGPGFLEGIYVRALCHEFKCAGLPFERERAITVNYKGVAIPGQRVDLIVADAVLVEVKAVAGFDAVHHAQVLSYLRTTGLRVGLLMNFNVALLKHGLKRIVL